MSETEHNAAEQIEATRTGVSYISPNLPSMIRGLYRADLREKSVQNILDLAADLVQELIDIRAAVGVAPDELGEDGTRRGGRYPHEMSRDEHRELADALNTCNSAVMLSGYASDLYGEKYEAEISRAEQQEAVNS